MHERVPILTKLLTYFVRSKAVAALKAVHTSQAASHSVGSLHEKEVNNLIQAFSPFSKV